jgi:hypothetical protein
MHAWISDFWVFTKATLKNKKITPATWEAEKEGLQFKAYPDKTKVNEIYLKGPKTPEGGGGDREKKG